MTIIDKEVVNIEQILQKYQPDPTKAGISLNSKAMSSKCDTTEKLLVKHQNTLREIARKLNGHLDYLNFQ